MDGHLPKEEITGHGKKKKGWVESSSGGHFEFYRASMSINGTMAVKLWRFKVSSSSSNDKIYCNFL